ncbi:methyltransferase-like protein 22 isoform X2 [Lytechinus variegatus]|uniref:methyltransferase-like protein 22 isoform X2 n=1 Tax=Lytechinus variegatus TaxID=7654 RepID=UPI001BB26896|nr:methyltransferase-like protein 22 isoform X2 [Lytechinus variegatus]
MAAESEMVEDQILSDVHVTAIRSGISRGYEKGLQSLSRFVVNYQAGERREERMKEESKKDSQDDINAMTDIDGDLVLTRKHKAKDVITIAHAMQTNLQDVGMQVWMGCLLLCNFILNNCPRFENSTVLELGGGTGLASVVMATTAKYVICTDTGKDVLEMCERNVIANKDIYNRRGHELERLVIVRALDWMDSDIQTDESIPFSWSQKDLQLLSDVDVIIAADVVYSNDLTDAFFTKLLTLMKTGKQKTCFITTERREWLKRLETTSDYRIKQLDSDVPQFIQYPQSRYLELWQIQQISSAHLVPTS